MDSSYCGEFIIGSSKESHGEKLSIWAPEVKNDFMAFDPHQSYLNTIYLDHSKAYSAFRCAPRIARIGNL